MLHLAGFVGEGAHNVVRVGPSRGERRARMVVRRIGILRQTIIGRSGVSRVRIKVQARLGERSIDGAILIVE